MQGQPPPPPPYAWGHPPRPPEPDNTPAVVGFALAIASLVLLLFSLGLSSVLSLGLAIAGLVLSRQGRQKVAAGETRKHDGLAQAGFWCGIGGIVLSVLAIVVWALFVVLLATSDNWRDDFDTDPAEPAVVRVLA